MLRPFTCCLIFLCLKLTAQEVPMYTGHVLCGLWNAHGNHWQYFFDERGEGFLMINDSLQETEHFHYRIDTSGVLDRVTIQFNDSLLPSVCILIEDDNPNTLFVYSLDDARTCPSGPNDRDIQSVIWRRSLDGQ